MKLQQAAGLFLAAAMFFSLAACQNFFPDSPPFGDVSSSYLEMMTVQSEISPRNFCQARKIAPSTSILAIHSQFSIWIWDSWVYTVHTLLLVNVACCQRWIVMYILTCKCNNSPKRVMLRASSDILALCHVSGLAPLQPALPQSKLSSPLHLSNSAVL